MSINRKMAKGAAWVLAFKLAHRTMTLIATIVLARLLIPEDFGLVALVTAVVGALALLSAFSFDVVLIQHPNPQPVHYDTVWTIQLIVELTIASLLVVVSTSVASFYNEPRLVGIFLVLALSTSLGAFSNVGVVNFRKELQFDKDFLFMFVPKLIGFCVTIPLAFWLRSYWALVIGTFVIKVTSLCTSYFLSPYRPKLSLGARRELIGFSKWLFLNNILIFLRMRSADFVIGKIAGPESLGTFTVANEISAVPTTELVAPINRAVFPGYAKMSGDLDLLRKGYLDVIGLIAALALPLAAGISATSELLVIVFLGQKWIAAVPIIAVLGLSGAIRAMETNVGTVFYALGRPRVVTALSALNVVILIPALIIFTIHSGPIGAANAIILTALVNLPVHYGVICRTLNLPFLTLIAAIWRPLFASCLLYLGVRFLTNSIVIESESLAALPQLFLATTIGVVIYVVGLLSLWFISSKPAGAEMHILSEIGRRITLPRILRVDS